MIFWILSLLVVESMTFTSWQESITRLIRMIFLKFNKGYKQRMLLPKRLSTTLNQFSRVVLIQQLVELHLGDMLQQVRIPLRQLQVLIIQDFRTTVCTLKMIFQNPI